MAQTKPVNMKLPDVTKRQIRDIKEATVFTSNTAVTVAAIDFFYRHAVLGEAVGQPTIIIVNGDGVHNLPISPETATEIGNLIGAVSNN